MLTQVRPVTVPPIVKGIYQYCATLVLPNGDTTYAHDEDGYVADEIETVFPCFDHFPTEKELDDWFTGWFNTGYQLSSIFLINQAYDEF